MQHINISFFIAFLRTNSLLVASWFQVSLELEGKTGLGSQIQRPFSLTVELGNKQDQKSDRYDSILPRRTAYAYTPFSTKAQVFWLKIEKSTDFQSRDLSIEGLKDS